ncbi:hypothetical protein [Actinomadura violacea]|uniref:Knr4/Smi1-like domain-containing protein n=1 Tax=Actinomadura violacea TaxID=2819934 RepID=A0ABS3RU19_9ACTN|nr:hypothetical protein [Actinomadura violacea]MBO2460249.1 hypothetical protein [Actinomadura violacea]
MAEIIDYGRFADRLAARRARWDLLREFQDEWGYTVPAGAVPWPKWSETEHRTYVRTLHEEWTGEEEDPFKGVDRSLPIPKALDEWWDLPFNSFTHSSRLYWTNPEYPPTLRPDPSGYGVAEGLPEENPFVEPGGDLRLCCFMAEYEYCNEWAYLASEAGQDDPRVFVSIDEDGWALQAESLSEFFVLLAAVRLPSHFGWSVQLGDDDFPDGVRARIEAAYRPMGLQNWRELGADTAFFGGPDVIVRHDTGMADYSVDICGRTREALAATARTLGWTWDDDLVDPPAKDAESD